MNAIADFTVRPAQSDDLYAIWQLVCTQNEADYDDASMTLDDLQQRWQSPNLLQTWAAFNLQDRLAGYVELHVQERQPNRFYPLLYLVNDAPGETLGACLLQLIEEWIVENGSGETAVHLSSRVSGRNQSIQTAFRQAGYQHKYTFLTMEIIITQPPPDAAWPTGITVRTFTPGQDEQATYLADEEASQDKGYHQPLAYDEWATRMGLNQAAFDPTLWFLADTGHEIVGVALNFYNDETNTGWIDHLGVRRRYRQQGLGMALLRHTFAAFYRRGVRRIRLNVDAHSPTRAPRLYERGGMKIIQQYDIYGKELKHVTNISPETHTP